MRWFSLDDFLRETCAEAEDALIERIAKQPSIAIFVEEFVRWAEAIRVMNITRTNYTQAVGQGELISRLKGLTETAMGGKRGSGRT